jgi:hypothetical protein
MNKEQNNEMTQCLPFEMSDADVEADKAWEKQVSKMSTDELDAMYAVPKEDTTCFKCAESGKCEFAYDPYNTDGDCLASK